jgi:hypothetical protein
MHQDRFFSGWRKDADKPAKVKKISRTDPVARKAAQALKEIARRGKAKS